MKSHDVRYLIAVIFFLTVAHLFNNQVEAACLSTSTINGNQTVTASCSVAADTTEAAQACTLSESATNTGTITLSCTGGCVSNLVTVSSGSTGTTLLLGYSISLGSNTAISVSCSACQIKLDSGNKVWVTDADADGWSSAIDTTFTATASGRRLRCLMRSTTADCNDAAYSETNTCYGAFSPYSGFHPYGGFYPQFSP